VKEEGPRRHTRRRLPSIALLHPRCRPYCQPRCRTPPPPRRHRRRRRHRPRCQLTRSRQRELPPRMPRPSSLPPCHPPCTCCRRACCRHRACCRNRALRRACYHRPCAAVLAATAHAATLCRHHASRCRPCMLPLRTLPPSMPPHSRCRRVRCSYFRAAAVRTAAVRTATVLRPP